MLPFKVSDPNLFHWRWPFVLGAFLFGVNTCIISQPTNLGDPPVVNYYKKDIRSGTQTWEIAEDSLGYTYFANNEGMLVFDGYNWDLYPLPNQTVVRSVAVGEQGRVYVGGQGEFGYFAPNKRGVLEYHSLLALIEPQDSSFEDVWDIIIDHQGIFFRTNNQVFLYAGGRISGLFNGDHLLPFIGKWGDEVVVQDEFNRLYHVDQTGVRLRETHSLFDKGLITGVLNYKPDSILVTTSNNGIFVETKTGFVPWETSHDDFWRRNIIYCSTLMPDGRILIGTTFNGMAIIDPQRRVVQHLHKKNGLQNNTVLSILGTTGGNIWLGLDNGIDLVDLRNPFRVYFPDGELEGAGSAVALFNNYLYFGTNSGLYSVPWKKYYLPEEKKMSRLLPETRGQVWSLNPIGEQLLIGHHEGAFQIERFSSRKISNQAGVWKFIQLNEHTALAGFYKGLILFEKQGGQWNEKRVLKGFTESSRIITQDAADNIWIGHPYRGVFFIPRSDIFDTEVKPIQYSHQNNLNKVLQNVFYDINHNIVLTDGQQFFRYNPDEKTLASYPDLERWGVPASSLEFLIQDTYQNLWYGTRDATYLMVPEKILNPSFQKYPINEITGLLPGGFESVYAIDKHNVIFPTEKGFLFFDPIHYIENTETLEIFLTKAVLHANPDSLFFTGHLGSATAGKGFNFKKAHNNFSFFFSVKNHAQKEHILYRHKIDGSDPDWSEWTSSPVISIRNLPPGRYSLIVKAKYESGAESDPYAVNFHIIRPWYEYALWLGIVMAAFSAASFFFKRQQKKYDREKSHLLESNKEKEQQYLNYAKTSREEITRLQNEKLMAEINFKNQELISFTYHLVNKNELITEINTVAKKLEKRLDDQPEIKKELKQILRITERNADIDANWQDFVKSFDQVHTNFYKRLTEEFPNLSPSDYKMCTYLRMNLSTKEIASLMNISIRSVETNRYRLRKKLDLASGANLNQFLMNY
ncbi:MAG: hypothetical protein H6555_11255 [Lewinellaceae bacterium]|nr:hypothetical protein [Lewinellaceae bacterium]